MRLKRIDISGFKSFPERSVINLPDGVTAIVGPNGCGKTNILDALRWSLGEQRPTLLRGGKMEDVIFNGSQTHKPLGMAEVILTVENTKGILPTEYNELQITRRLYRSGESEYMLNKVSCRLKDITDLFADTGMGSNAYSVIQQDMIDSLISDKADERRLMFEEAAGITKYKQRKRAALRKLDATEADLARLNDILSEVKTHVNSLNRQMKKAERFRNIRDQLKALELRMGKATIEDIDIQIRQSRLVVDERSDLMMKLRTEIDSLGAKQEERLEGMREFDSVLTKINQDIQANTEESHSLERRSGVLRERIQSLSELQERNRIEIRSCDKRIAEINPDEESQKEKLLAKESGISDLMIEIRDAEIKSEESDKRLLDTRKAKENDTEKLISLEGKISSGKSDNQNLSEQKNELKSRLEQFNKESESATLELNEARETRSKAISKLKEISTRESKLTKTLRELNSFIEDGLKTLDDLSDETAALNASMEAASARSEVLEEMIAEHTGFGSGAADALNNKDSWEGLLGAVAELITPRPGYVRAIEAALGDIASRLVATKRNTAMGIINNLRQEQKGQAKIYVLEGQEADSAKIGIRAPLDITGFLGWANVLVDTTPEVSDLAKRLLRDVAIFDDKIEDIPSAGITELLGKIPSGCVVVTTRGTLFDGLRMVSGGSEDSFPLLGRKERLVSIAEEIKKTRSELEKAQSRKNQLSAQIAASRAELTKIDSQLEPLREEILDSEKESSSAESVCKQIEERLGRIENERKKILEKQESLQARQYTLSLDVDQLSAEKERLMGLITGYQSEVGDMERMAQKSAENYNSLSVKLVEERSAINELTARITHLQEVRHEIAQTRTRKTQEIENAKGEVNAASEEIAKIEVSLKTALDRRSELSARETTERQKREEIALQVKAQENSIREARGRKDKALEESHSRELKLNQLDNDRATLIDHIQEEYGVDLANYALPEKDEQFQKDNRSPEEAETAMKELKEKVKGFGPVNLLAIEEFETASERFEYLDTQMVDLLSAKATLQSTIAKINKTAREMFTETFNKARKNFQHIFTELFTGGECDLKLVDESDPLESEIEIIAKPKGKKLVTITQMSGGERALTAISILFSLYLVKPSPFCILDEIDAPLDDANCHRFLKIIRRFSAQTQFIIITHNKITMQAADTLYGVTMETPGVSKLVSVDFGDVHDDRQLDTGSPEHSSAERKSTKPQSDESLRSEPLGDEPEIPAPVVERMTSRLAPQNAPDAKNDDLS